MPRFSVDARHLRGTAEGNPAPSVGPGFVDHVDARVQGSLPRAMFLAAAANRAQPLVCWDPDFLYTFSSVRTVLLDKRLW